MRQSQLAKNAIFLPSDVINSLKQLKAFSPLSGYNEIIQL